VGEQDALGARSRGFDRRQPGYEFSGAKTSANPFDPMIIRQILDRDGRPAFDVFCFAYSYPDEGGAIEARDRVQARVLRPGESGYISRVMIQGERVLEHALIAVALGDHTRDLFLTADWGPGATDACKAIGDQVWTDAILSFVRMSTEGGPQRAEKVRRSQEARAIFPPDSR
jgi:hypothetical protein